ncbi:MAG: hypothetical protein JWO95_3534 [Verrucomicrobiales bacterium]|nr:hypothetical protein [Verrucomicrobiales bacterium]
MCDFDLIMQTTTATKEASATDCDSYCDWGATELEPVAPGRTQSHPVTPSRSNFFPLFFKQIRSRREEAQTSAAINGIDQSLLTSAATSKRFLFRQTQQSSRHNRTNRLTVTLVTGLNRRRGRNFAGWRLCRSGKRCFHWSRPMRWFAVTMRNRRARARARGCSSNSPRARLRRIVRY